MLGSGFMGQGLTNQIVNSVPGMGMVAIYSRKPEKALEVFRYAGLREPVLASTQSQLDEAISTGQPMVTEDAMLLAGSEHNVLVDVTGSVEFGARVALGGVQPQEGRRADERRDRCHDRADPADLCRAACRAVSSTRAT
jgi:predicted homoserine dehydrogenase-like protein